MNCASIISRRIAIQKPIIAGARKTTARAFASNASSSQNQQSNWNGKFSSLAAATLGLGSAATTIAFCEKSQADPQTQYSASGAYVQATSPEQLLNQGETQISIEEQRLEEAVNKAKKTCWRVETLFWKW